VKVKMAQNAGDEVPMPPQLLRINEQQEQQQVQLRELREQLEQQQLLLQGITAQLAQMQFPQLQALLQLQQQDWAQQVSSSHVIFYNDTTVEFRGSRPALPMPGAAGPAGVGPIRHIRGGQRRRNNVYRRRY
jgi:hypothetical protein